MKKIICMLIAVILLTIPCYAADISSNTVFKSYNGETVSSIKNLNYADIELKVTNSSNESRGIIITIALYRNNEILRIVKAKNPAFSGSTEKIYKTGMPLPKDKTNLKIKAFVTDYSNNMLSGEMVLQ